MDIFKPVCIYIYDIYEPIKSFQLFSVDIGLTVFAHIWQYDSHTAIMIIRSGHTWFRLM